MKAPLRLNSYQSANQPTLESEQPTGDQGEYEYRGKDSQLRKRGYVT